MNNEPTTDGWIQDTSGGERYVDTGGRVTYRTRGRVALVRLGCTADTSPEHTEGSVLPAACADALSRVETEAFLEIDNDKPNSRPKTRQSILGPWVLPGRGLTKRRHFR